MSGRFVAYSLQCQLFILFKGVRYNLKNKDNLKIYKSKKHICECGMPYTIGHKSRHEKTKKHLSNSNKLII